MTAETKKDGLLEVTLKENGQRTVKIIYATKIVSNEKEYWKYVQRNGRTLTNISPLNPKLWARQLANEYVRREISGKIHWKYINHTQHEMVPE